MKGSIKIEKDGETHEVELTKKDIKVLMNLMVDVEKEYCRGYMGNVREAQKKDPRLKTLYKILGYGV